MSDALIKIMNLPVTGFDNNGEETVNREAAAYALYAPAQKGG